MTSRPGWDIYYLGITDSVSVRADCTRRKVGAIVVRDNAIISTGYNGSPPGEPGCLSDGACPRGRHYKTMGYGSMDYSYHCGGCGPKVAWPCAMAVAPGSSYDTGPGACIALHAEQNALIRAGDRAQGAILYCTEKPCDGCMRLIQGAGIQTAVWYGGQWSRETKKSWLRRIAGHILKAWR
jgi:dCMP deaminase